jgi:WD40 repeat protein
MQAVPSGCLPGGGGGTPLFNLPPTVVLTADLQRGVAPLTVLFSSSGSTDDGVIVQRLWDFGDGVGTSQEISPTYTFRTTGDYTVTLTLLDDQGARASDSIIIYVTERPVAIIAVDRTEAENAPATFNFDGSASYDPDAKEGEELLYRWDFGDGSRELIPVVPHTFASSGTYRVRLTVTDAVGVTGFTEKIIEVGITRPTISFRTPPAGVTNIVCTNTETAVLWVHAVYDVEPGVPYTLRAGLDGDRDPCEALVAVYDSQTGDEVQRLTDPTNVFSQKQGTVRAAVFSPDADNPWVLAGGDDSIARLYDPFSGALLRRYTGNSSGITALAFAPDGATFVIGYRSGSVLLRETNSNTIIRSFAGHVTTVNAAAFSPDGSQLITGDESGLAILWNVSNGSAALRYDHGGAAVTAVAFSPANPQRVLTGSSDWTARLWSTVNGRLMQEFAPVYSDGTLVAGHADDVTSVAFSTDGTLIVTGSADHSAIIWNVALGSEVLALVGHTEAVRSVGFSPDNRQIITGSDDGTALIWDLATGKRVRTLQSCVSPIVAVGFAPDGQTVLAGVAAQNDIQLDTDPSSGNDLNLTMPTALRLSTRNYTVPSSAEGRRYYLWVELDTDRTTPSRTYSQARVNVVPPFTEGITDDTPIIPYRNDEATVLMPESLRRQILDLGPLDVGDRVFLSLVSLPGYGEVYTQAGLNPIIPPSLAVPPGFSVLMLDAQEKMFVWYDTGRVLFTPDSKLVIGHSSNSYYIVLDATGGQLVPSVKVRVQRGFSTDSDPRVQYVHLNFDGGNNIAVSGSSLFDIPAFTVAGRTATAINTIKSAIVARVSDLLSSYGFVVSTDPPANSAEPRLTVYFDVSGELLGSEIPDRDGDGLITASDLLFWGLPDYIDPRNETLSGRAVVAVYDIVSVPAYNALADGQLGLAIGNSALHQIGLMCGLRETTQALPDDIMTEDSTQLPSAALDFTTADLVWPETLDPIGIQDGPELLTELFGAR